MNQPQTQYPRDLGKVIDNLIAHAPPGHPVIKRLNSIKRSCLFTAPEMLRFRWYEVSEALEAHLGPPVDGLPKEMADIFAGSH